MKNARLWAGLVVAVGAVGAAAVVLTRPEQSEAAKRLGTKGSRKVFDAVHSLPTNLPYFYERGKESPGVAFDLVHKGQMILRSNGTVHCSGTTLTAVFIAANQLGLLDDKTPAQVKDFYLRWFGARGDTERQQGPAMEHLGIGGSIEPGDAIPGDFVQLWRKSGTGHSVVFVDWAKDPDTKQIIGIKYRSAQGPGIGTKTEYFSDAPGGEKYGVLRKRTYFSRLASARQ